VLPRSPHSSLPRTIKILRNVRLISVTNEIFVASWNKISYNPLTQIRVLSYRTPCHKPFHLAINFKLARNNKTIRIDTTLINNTKAFFIVNNCFVYLLYFFYYNQPMHNYITKVSLCVIHTSMFHHFYVIIREFYLCTLLRNVNS